MGGGKSAAYCELCFYETTKSQQDQKERGEILMI